ncbi:MAG: metallopeptidase family protein [Myxococcales bacterium]|nr:metallopeptidase family protein [Myxococcales bacterium]MCB9569747.1 metallopeptidase family protein [Myxococcales bacterium]MCB9701698.1 metallopeptidase family protein [Myxococcales bacterium]
MASEPSEHDDSGDEGFGENSRYAAHLDRGWSLLDRADYSAARQSARHAQRLRPDAPDAPVLLGAIALAEGDAEESLRCYESAIEIDPEYLEPYLAAAQVALFDLGDAGRALQICDEALELEGISAFDTVDLGLLSAECQLSLGQVDAARDRLTAVAGHGLIEAAVRGDLAEREAAGAEHVLNELVEDEDGEPLDDEERDAQQTRLLHLCLRLGRLWLDAGLPDEALPLLRSLVERYADNADAWHLLSEAEYQHGDPRAACHAALRVYRLDSQLAVPKWLPNPAQLHRKVVQILTECPDSALRELGQRRVALVVLVHEMPSMELVLEGVDPRVTALALASRGPQEGASAHLTGIAIYRRNIMRLARSPELFDQELRFAVLEELAVFLQLDDDRRVALGLHPLGEGGMIEEVVVNEPAPEEPKPSRRRRRKRMHS